MKNLSPFIIMFCVLVLGFIDAYSQAPLVKKWDARFGGNNDDHLSSIQQTNDGGYILGGWTNSDSSGDISQSSRGFFDYWIVKTDSEGRKQWDKRFGGSSYDYLSFVQPTKDGGYILGGGINSDSSGDVTQRNKGHNEDYWIVKTDSAGNKQWDKRFGGNNNDALLSLQQTNDGGYILGGSSNSDSSGDVSQTNRGESDYWIVKTDPTGKKQWDRRLGGNRTDYLYVLQQTMDGGYILGGITLSDRTADVSQAPKGAYDYWMIKTDSAGNKKWDKRFGGNEDDHLYYLEQTKDGGYILGGVTTSDSSGDVSQPNTGSVTTSDYWIVKTDSSGDKEWDKRFGGKNNEDEFGYVKQTSDGGYLLSGSSFSDISGDKTENNLGHGQSWLVKTDSNGNKLWDKTIFTNTRSDNDRSGYSIQTTDGGYIIANSTSSDAGGYQTQISRGFFDFWMAKFSDTSHCLRPINSIIVINDTLLSFNTASSYQWYFNNSIIAGAKEQLYVASEAGYYFVQIIDMNGCLATSNPVVYTNIHNLIEEEYVRLYPNPASNIITIQSSENATAELMDIQGKHAISQTKINAGERQGINTEKLSSGVYLIKVFNDNFISTKKVILNK